MGAGRPKALVEIEGAPILVHTVRAIRSVPEIGRLVILVEPEAVERARQVLAPELRGGPEWQCAGGGADRQESVWRGLQILGGAVDVAVVHDAARPLVSPALIAECARVAAERGAAIAAVPVTDTVKELDAEGCVVQTLDRTRLWCAQTPQAFRFALLQRAHERALREGWRATDDAALVERDGVRVWVVLGERANLKITAPEDLAWAAWWLRSRRDLR